MTDDNDRYNGDTEQEINEHSGPDSSKEITESPEHGAIDPAARIKELEQTVATLTERLPEGEAKRQRDHISRRSVLGMLGIAGLVGLGSGAASAAPQGQIGTPSRPLSDLYTTRVESPQAEFLLLVNGNSVGTFAHDGNHVDVLLGTNASSGGASQSSGRTVGGGASNVASGQNATVAGGRSNTASGLRSTVGGGIDNTASGEASAVAGGENNEASGSYATVAGGQGSSATAPNSFAGGTNASASHEGAFIWCDTSSGGLASANDDEFAVSARGGTYIFSNESATTGVQLSPGSGSWSSASSRALKSDVEHVSGEAVLNRVTDLDISTWSYDSQDDVRHMGPMAEEFHEMFELGADEEKISNVDADGVALGAIQGLAERGDDRDAKIESQSDRLETLEQENDALRERLATLEAQIEDAGAD